MTACANHAGTPAAAYCRTCGKPLCDECKRDVRGVIYCEECIAARLEGTAPPQAFAAGGTVSPPGTPNPTLAAFLGIIPGVGAFYNGQYQKGIVHVLMFPALIMLTDKVSDYFGFLIPCYFFYMMWDAYMTAKSRVTGEPVPDPLGINNMFGLDAPARTPAAAAAAGGTIPGGASQPASAAAPAQAPWVPSRAPIGAFVLIGLGVLFLLGDISHRLVENALPVLLIAIGLWKGISRWHMTE